MVPGGARYPAWARPTTSTRCTASAPASATSSRGQARLLLPARMGGANARELPSSLNINGKGATEPVPPRVHTSLSPPPPPPPADAPRAPAPADGPAPPDAPPPPLALPGKPHTDRVSSLLSEVTSRPRAGQTARLHPCPHGVSRAGSGTRSVSGELEAWCRGNRGSGGQASHLLPSSPVLRCEPLASG